MDWVVVVAIAVPVLALLGLVVVAWLLPVHVISRRSQDMPHRAEELWALLLDFEHYPQWRRSVRSVSRVPSAPHEELWRESYGRFGLTLRTEIEEPGRVLIREVVGRKLDFGGSWRFELTPLRTGGTRLAVTESAEYYRPMHRLLARFVTGEGRQIEAFLADLSREMVRQNPLATVREGLARA